MTLPTEDDRRPIPQRDHRPWRVAAAKLVNAGVSANAVSVFGMAAALLAGGLLAATSLDAVSGWAWRACWISAAILIPLRLVANMLDGMVAVASGTASPVGELFNEVPDRVSDSAVLVGLGYAAASTPWLGWAAALLAMMTAYIRAVGKCAGAPQTFVGPMAKQHRMWIVVVAALTAAAYPPALRPAGFGVADTALALIAAGSAVTCLRRLGILVRGLQSGAAA